MKGAFYNYVSAIQAAVRHVLKNIALDGILFYIESVYFILWIPNNQSITSIPAAHCFGSRKIGYEERKGRIVSMDIAFEFIYKRQEKLSRDVG